MLVLVAPVAMLVSTGLRGLADLWCSTTRERLAVSAGTCYCFLYSIQASPRGSLFPCVTLPWSTIDYVSNFICMNDLCLSFALHSSNEEMLIQFCPKAVIFFYMYDESWELHYKRSSHFDRWKGEFSYHTSSLGLIIKHLCYESKIKRSWAGGGFFFFLNSLWCVCLSALDERVLKGTVHPLSPYFYPLTQKVCKTKAKGSRVMKWQCSQWLIQAEACFVVGQECAD